MMDDDSDDELFFNFDRDKNPEKYNGAVETTSTDKKLTKEEKKRLEEKRKLEKIEHEKYWEEYARKEKEKVIERAKKKKEEILSKSKKKNGGNNNNNKNNEAEDDNNNKNKKKSKTTNNNKKKSKEKKFDILNFAHLYKLNDLYLCKQVMHIKGTNSKKMYYPCAVIPQKYIFLPDIDENQFHDPQTRNVWRLGLKQPSKDGFKYVDKDDCILYDPEDIHVQNILQEQTKDNKVYKKAFQKGKKKQIVQYEQGLKEIHQVYEYIKKENNSQTNQIELTQEELQFKFEENSQGNLISSQRGARRQVNNATTNISKKKITLHAGDHITYNNTLTDIAGSKQAVRRAIILQINAKEKSIKLDNGEEYLFKTDPTTKMSIVRSYKNTNDKKNNKTSGRSFNEYTLITGKIKNMDEILNKKNEGVRDIFHKTQQEIQKFAKKEGMSGIIANLNNRSGGDDDGGSGSSKMGDQIVIVKKQKKKIDENNNTPSSSLSTPTTTSSTNRKRSSSNSNNSGSSTISSNNNNKNKKRRK